MFDEVSTAAQSESLSETTLLTELERQAEQELRSMLIAKARRERAESAAFTAAALADPAGMRIDAPTLWNRCSAAVNLARKATRVPLSEDDFRDAVADLVCTAIRNDTAADRMRPASAQPYWHRRRTADPVQALFHAPYGTPRADARMAKLERDAALFGGTLPRAGRCAMPWLQATANGRLKDRAAAHASSGVTSTGDLDTAAAASTGRYLADLTAADVVAATGIDAAPAVIALRSAIDGEALSDIGAELGMSHATARKSAQRGRSILADRWEDIARAIAADPADPLDSWAIARSALERLHCERPDRAGATYSTAPAALPPIRTAADVLRRMDALERALARIERYAPNSVDTAAAAVLGTAPSHPGSHGQWAQPITREDPPPHMIGTYTPPIVGSAIQALARPTDWPTRTAPEHRTGATAAAMLAEVAGYAVVTLESDAPAPRPTYVSHSERRASLASDA